MIADRGLDDEGKPLMTNKRVWQEIPRLSEGLAAGGPFGREPLRRAFSALDSFREHVLQHKAMKVLAGATMAARLSSEGPWFAEEIRKRYGWEARILTGEEEAFYTARGVLERFGDKGEDEDRLIFDIGGRSTEFIACRAKSVLRSVSLPLGVVLLTEDCLKGDPPAPEELLRVSIRCREELRKASFTFPKSISNHNPYPNPNPIPNQSPGPSPGLRLIGTAGTVTTIAAMLMGLSEYEPSRLNGAQIARDAIWALLMELSKETLKQRSKRKGLHPRRADLILAGLSLALEIMDFYKESLLTVSDDGLLEGLWLLSAGFISHDKAPSKASSKAS
jgi:exopolyphosphatase/guanosine-5'-triphosphate,3'-diphosphate pyrophosphatase